jgi:tetratricopeptide (TPR) repeat protein
MAGASCSTLNSVFVPGAGKPESKPISNPFNDYQRGPASASGDSMFLRTKSAGSAVEVEIPSSSQNVSDFVIPISNLPKSADRAPASSAETPANENREDKPFELREAGLADREIIHNFPKGSNTNNSLRQEIEQQLGLVRSEDETPEKQKSYLGAVDRIKQLYRTGRYEAALLLTDDMLREYPTSPRLYEMRGTLFERIGQSELALKAWKQALRFNPGNEPLRRFIARKEQKRSLASP